MNLLSLFDNPASVTVEEDEEEGEEEDDVWERNPSLSEMFKNGVPTDYLVIVFISFLICICVLSMWIFSLSHS